MPQLHFVWPPLDDRSREARHDLVELAKATVGAGDGIAGDAYPQVLDRLTRAALASPEAAGRLLEAAGTLIALAVGRMALDDTDDFVRGLDEVDFVIEAAAFERSVDEVLSEPPPVEPPGSPLGGFPG